MAISHMSPSLKDSEGRILKILLALSAAVHVSFFFVTFDNTKTIEMQEWEMDVDLMGEFDMPKAVPKDTLKNVKEGEELKVVKEALPQLPKRFEVEEKREEKPSQEDLAEQAASHDQKAREEAARKEKEAKKRKEEKLNVIKKNEALARLLKEKARLEKKFAKETQAPKNDKLAQRKAELEGKGNQASSITKIAASKYQGVLVRHIRRNYRLPDAYNLKNADIRVKISLALAASGSIQSISIHESSGRSAFDQLALETIKKSTPLPRPPKALVGQNVIFVFSPRTL